MPHQRARLGQRGELLAARYLETQGYRILSRNVNTPSGEIDIVALDGDTLVIVEVRTRRGNTFGTAAESITAKKQAKLRRVATEYLLSQPAFTQAFRIDVVLVELRLDGEILSIELLPAAVEGE